MRPQESCQHLTSSHRATSNNAVVFWGLIIVSSFMEAPLRFAVSEQMDLKFTKSQTNICHLVWLKCVGQSVQVEQGVFYSSCLNTKLCSENVSGLLKIPAILAWLFRHSNHVNLKGFKRIYVKKQLITTYNTET